REPAPLAFFEFVPAPLRFGPGGVDVGEANLFHDVARQQIFGNLGIDARHRGRRPEGEAQLAHRKWRVLVDERDAIVFPAIIPFQLQGLRLELRSGALAMALHLECDDPRTWDLLLLQTIRPLTQLDGKPHWIEALVFPGDFLAVFFNFHAFDQVPLLAVYG